MGKIKGFNYIVFCLTSNGCNNYEVKHHKTINSLNDYDEIENKLKNKHELEYIKIVNFKLVSVDEDTEV